MTRGPYAEYKASGIAWVDRIPKGWETVPFFTVFREAKKPNTGMAESNLLSLSFGRIVRKDIDAVGGLLPESFETYQIIEPGDIVFRFTDLQNDHRSLRTALCPERGIITSAYGKATPAGIDPQFANYLMRAYDTSKVFYSFGGGVRQSIKLADVARMPVILPPPEEQGAVVRYLDHETAMLDVLIAEQEGLLGVLRERRAAVIDRSVVPLEGDESSWKRTALKYMIRDIDQGVSPQAEAGLADETGSWGVLKSGCVNRGIFRQEEHKRLADDFEIDPADAVAVGDLIVSRASGSPSLVGSAGIVDALDYQLILSDKLFRLRPAVGVDARFLMWSLNSRWYRAQVHQSISGAEGLANNLPLSALRGFEMYCPPVETQREVADFLDDETRKVDALIAEAEGVVAVAKERRTAVITAAVTGQIDVQGEVA
jgi:type I restriction enzyme S subunit